MKQIKKKEKTKKIVSRQIGIRLLGSGVRLLDKGIRLSHPENGTEMQYSGK